MSAQKEDEAPIVDGRTLRRSNRTVTFSTKVTPEFNRAIRAIAVEKNIMIVEVLERLLSAHKYRSEKYAQDQEAAAAKAAALKATPKARLPGLKRPK